MSRRKAGCVPRRVDPEPDGDDMETPELVIDVKPEHDAGALARGLWSPKDVSMPRFLGTERRLGTDPRPLGARSPCAPWIPLSPEPSGESPVFGPVGIGTLGWMPLCSGARLAYPALAPACTGTLCWCLSAPEPVWGPQPSLLRAPGPPVGASPLGMAPGRPGLPSLRL